MESIVSIIVTVLCSVIASSGFWAWIQKKDDKKSLQSQMLIGLAHDRIVALGMTYIERGWITKSARICRSDLTHRYERGTSLRLSSCAESATRA